MAEFEYDSESLNSLLKELTDSRKRYWEERDAITESTYSGSGKVTDVMQTLDDRCSQLLGYMDELYGRGVTLMNYVIQQFEAIEEQV